MHSATRRDGLGVRLAEVLLEVSDLEELMFDPEKVKRGPYICHYWQSNFLSVVETLERHLGLETWIWFDLFCLDQSGAEQKETMCSSTLETIKECGHVVMVCDVTQGSVSTMGALNACSRAWCLFEAYTSVVTDCSFAMHLTASAHHTVEKDKEYWTKIFLEMNICIQDAACSVPDDKRRILEQVRWLLCAPDGPRQLGADCSMGESEQLESRTSVATVNTALDLLFKENFFLLLEGDAAVR